MRLNAATAAPMWICFLTALGCVAISLGLYFLGARTEHVARCYAAVEEDLISLENLANRTGDTANLRSDGMQLFERIREQLPSDLRRSAAGITLSDAINRLDFQWQQAVQPPRQLASASPTHGSAPTNAQAMSSLDRQIHSTQSMVAHELMLLSEARRSRTFNALFLGLAAIASGIAGLFFMSLCQRKLNQAEQVEAQSLLLAAAVRSTDEGIIISNLGTKNEQPQIVFVNRSFCNMTGYTDNELLGSSLRNLQESITSDELEALERSFSSSESTRAEAAIRRKDGWRFNCEWHISPVRLDEGRITHFVASVRDISERKAHEQALRKKSEELSAANESLRKHQQQLIQQERMASLGQLATGVAHEIKHPVAYVSSHVETLLDDVAQLLPIADFLADLLDTLPTELDSGTHRALTAVQNQAGTAGLRSLFESMTERLKEAADGLSRICEIVKSLRSFACPAADEPFQLHDIHEVIDSALRIVASELRNKCEVITDYADLPLIPCRPGQLTQVMNNLLVNGAQAIPRWGRITITTTRDGAEVLIRVTDTGEGITPENLKRLFTPFFTTKPDGKGTGLGLAISYGIINDHNGSITVTSTVGEGTTFEIRLPLARGTHSSESS